MQYSSAIDKISLHSLYESTPIDLIKNIIRELAKK